MWTLRRNLWLSLEDYYRQWKAQKKVMGAAWQKSLDRKSAKYASSLLCSARGMTL